MGGFRGGMHMTKEPKPLWNGVGVELVTVEVVEVVGGGVHGMAVLPGDVRVGEQA